MSNHKDSRKYRFTKVKPSHRPKSGSTHVGVCRVTGKRQYVRKDDAKAIRRQTGSTAHVYYCNACGHYELGRQYGLTRAQHEAEAARKLALGLTRTA